METLDYLERERERERVAEKSKRERERESESIWLMMCGISRRSLLDTDFVIVETMIETEPIAAQIATSSNDYGTNCDN